MLMLRNFEVPLIFLFSLDRVRLLADFILGPPH